LIVHAGLYYGGCNLGSEASHNDIPAGDQWGNPTGPITPIFKVPILADFTGTALKNIVVRNSVTIIPATAFVLKFFILLSTFSA